MNKTFSKSYIIPSLQLTLDSIVLNYCSLVTTWFIYAEDNIIEDTNWLLQISPHNWTNIEKKYVNIHSEKKTL